MKMVSIDIYPCAPNDCKQESTMCVCTTNVNVRSRHGEDLSSRGRACEISGAQYFISLISRLGLSTGKTGLCLSSLLFWLVLLLLLDAFHNFLNGVLCQRCGQGRCRCKWIDNSWPHTDHRNSIAVSLPSVKECHSC